MIFAVSSPKIHHHFAHLLKFNNSTLIFLAMSCEEMNPKNSVSGEELCQWRYNTCGPACPITCQHPNPLHCSLSCVEGCHAYCPPGAKILSIHQVHGYGYIIFYNFFLNYFVILKANYWMR